MYSLRRTLAVRFSLTLLIALLLIAVWAYLGARRILREALDRNIAAAAQLETAVVASRLPIAIEPGNDGLRAFVEDVNRFVAVRDSQGQIVEANTPLALDLPLDEPAFLEARNGRAAWATQHWEGTHLRSYYAPAPSGARAGHAVIQLAASLAPFESASREVLFLMLGTAVLAMVAAALGAGWLAASSVAPVAEITEQAKDVRPGVTGQRITSHADVEEFSGLVTVINGMIERLERALESQRRMIADTGHDLRTPLTAMRGQLEVALRGERRSTEYREVLRSVLEDVDHLVAISESLVLVARLESGALPLDCAEVDVAALAEYATERARARAGARSIMVQCPDNGASVVADSKMIGIVLAQLLDNSIKHTPEQTRVRVRVSEADNRVTVEVEDSGPGIGNDALPHLFEHFYRSDPSRTRSGAPTAGLGLTVAATIVSAHRGEIRADHGEMGGLRVTFTIPRDAAGDGGA